MAVREYIGARYVPVFADPVTWNQTSAYEALTMVTWEGATYTSRQPVPAGVDINNTNYWIVTGNYNAQVENYRQEVQRLAQDVAAFDGEVDAETLARQQADEQLATDIANEVLAREGADEQLATDIANEVLAREGADEQLENDIEVLNNKNIFSSKVLKGAYPIFRLERESKYSVQGNTYFEIQGIPYYAVSKLDITDTTYDSGGNCTEIDIINLNTNVSTPLYGEFRHCNQIVFDSDTNKLIVSGARSGIDGHLKCIFVNVANPATPFIEQTYDLTSLTEDDIIAVSPYGDGTFIAWARPKFNGVENNSFIRVYKINASFSSVTELFTVPKPESDWSPSSTQNQGFYWVPERDRGYFLISTSVFEFDIEGNITASFAFDYMYRYVKTAEVEGMSFLNGKMYFGNTTQYTTQLTTSAYLSGMDSSGKITHPTRVTALFCYDPLNIEADYIPQEYGTNRQFQFYLGDESFNANCNGLRNRQYFKYPEDLANALSDWNAKGISVDVNIETDQVNPVIITAPGIVNVKSHKLGLLVLKCSCHIYAMNTTDFDYCLLKDQYGRPVVSWCNTQGATIIISNQPTPAAGEYWLGYYVNVSLWGNTVVVPTVDNQLEAPRFMCRASTLNNWREVSTPPQPIE